jgi:acetyl esterase
MTPAEGRKVFNGLTDLFGHGPELHAVEEQVIAGRIAIRIYRPAAGQLPAIMFFHGGGWVLGNLDTHDTLCRRLAQGSGCVIVSVDYRVAPEYRYPAALDDCFDATQYVSEHAEHFGIDTRRLAVCGDSAGGNLAAAVALRAQEGHSFHLHSQWLIYPSVDPRCDSESYRLFGEGHALTRAAMQWFWDQYAPGAKELRDPGVAPIFAKSLIGLPATFVITAEFDPLRDEGEAYAAALRAAGVTVTAHRYDGMLHGFLHFAEPFDDGKRAVTDLAQVMRTTLKV